MSDSQVSRLPDSATDHSQYVVVARRYRPQTFDELIGQEHVTRALTQAIVSDRVGHAYLFAGARGVGKTSAARILAKALNCTEGPSPTPCNQCDICQSITSGDDVDVLEIDGASNRGIDEIRQLRQNAAIRPSRARFKIYIIDEVHMLSKDAFNALLKTLEEPPQHVKFIFATTEPGNIPVTILSRCQRFDFGGVNAKAIQTRLAQIATAEGVEIVPEALQILASRAAGSMRDGQSLLEQLLAVAGGKITTDEVNSLLGIAPAEHLSRLAGHLADRNCAAALAELDSALAAGAEPGQLLDQLLGYFRDVMATTVGCEAELLLYALPSQAGEIAELANKLGVESVLAIIQILDQTAARLRVSIQARTLVEMALVRICNLENLDEIAGLISQLREGGPVRTPADKRDAPAARKESTTPKPHAPPRASDPPPAAVASDRSGSQASGKAEVTDAVATDLWNRAVADLGGLLGNNAALAEQITATADDAISATFAEACYKDLCEQPENRQRIEEALSRVARRGVRVHFVVQPGGSVKTEMPAQRPAQSRREQKAEAAARPLVRRALELFDAGPGDLGYLPPNSGS